MEEIYILNYSKTQWNSYDDELASNDKYSRPRETLYNYRKNCYGSVWTPSFAKTTIRRNTTNLNLGKALRLEIRSEMIGYIFLLQSSSCLISDVGDL